MTFLRRFLAAILIAIALSCAAGTASSHELDSASLTLTEIASGQFRVDFRASSGALREDLAAPAVFPAPCRLAGSVLDCGSRGLAGIVEFPWLEGTRTRVVVDVAWRDGSHLFRVVTADAPTLNVYGVPATASGLRPIALDYTALGVEHILTGFDHLIFVVALTLLIRSTKALVGTITAFTLAHSVSLAASVLGIAAVPAAPVEAAIALSIVLVCAECMSSADSLTRRAPWIVAFVFGLFHGFGFASALLGIGVPENHVPLALFSFNLGVELGQLGVVALVAGLRHLLARVGLSETSWRHRALYVMGTVAAFWFFDRLGGVFEGR